jgi:hypothetical protein
VAAAACGAAAGATAAEFPSVDGEHALQSNATSNGNATRDEFGTDPP